MRIFVEFDGSSLQVLKHLLSLLLQDVHLNLLHLLLQVLAHQHFASHPRMTEDFRDGHAVGRIKGQHGTEQIFEL